MSSANLIWFWLSVVPNNFSIENKSSSASLNVVSSSSSGFSLVCLVLVAGSAGSSATVSSATSSATNSSATSSANYSSATSS